MRGRPIGASGFRGVSRSENGRYWAQLKTRGGKAERCAFETAEDAAPAYDKMARKASRPEAGLNFPLCGQAVGGVDVFSDASHKRRRKEASERASPGDEASEEDEESAGAAEEAADLAAWRAEAESASLPRLRELLQAAERRAAARAELQAAAAAAAAAARRAADANDAAVSALEAQDAKEAGVSARMRELISAAERDVARQARRREAREAAREAQAAVLAAAALQERAAVLAAELAEMEGISEGGTQIL